MLKIISDTGFVFDLYENTILSIEETSPLFSEQGSLSLPLDLPPTQGNLEELGFPNRLQRRKAFQKKRRVTVSIGTYVKIAEMVVVHVAENGDISTTIFLNTSLLNRKIKGRSLKDIFSSHKRDDFKNNPDDWIGYLEKVMRGSTVDDFHIFPVLLKVSDITEDLMDDKIMKVKASWSHFLIANRPAYWLLENGNDGGSISNSSSEGPYYTLPYKVDLYDDDGFQYLSPARYGLAPYLKFNYVLKELFKELGYSLSTSFFDSDESFKKLCVIHAVADALVGDTLSYSDLLPDVSVDDFLKMTENSFGCKFFVDEAKNTVTPIFWKDLLAKHPKFDLTPYLEDGAFLEFSNETFFSLKATREIEESQALRYETIQEAEREHGEFDYSLGFQNEAQLRTQLENPDFAGILKDGIYLLRNTRVLAAVDSAGKIKIVDKYAQDYCSGDTDLETIDTGFVLLPLYPTPLSGETAKTIEVKSEGLGFYFEDLVEQAFKNKYPEKTGLIGELLYLGKVQHVKTVLQKTTTSDDGETISYTEESEKSNSIYLAFCHGRAQGTYANPLLSRTFFASQDAFDNIGAIKGTFNMNPLSLTKNFWWSYRYLLEKSLHSVTSLLDLGLEKISNFSFSDQYIIDGVAVIPESLRYELSSNGVSMAEVSFRTVKAYD